jgi:rhamnosyltransferase
MQVATPDGAWPDAESQAVKLSVVIRTRNEAASLKYVLEALASQRFKDSWEIVVVDNESEDDTLTLCKQNQARVVSIAKHDFTYGSALNLGISHARGELILLLSAHSVPLGSYFFDAAVAPFADPSIAAVRCLYSGNLDQLKEWYRPRDIQYVSLEEQRQAESGLEWTRDYPAATCCVIRRSVWELVKFDERLEANEDKKWASQVLALGFKIRRCAEAFYTYTRWRGKSALRMRNYREFSALYSISGYVPITLTQFFLGVTKAILLAPIVGAKFAIDTIAWKAHLVRIPIQKYSARHLGSLDEFDRHA